MTTWTAALVLIVTMAFGCTPPCNHNALCSVSGQAPNITVCDGSDFKGCEDRNRGQVITCLHGNQSAVCTPQGWDIQQVPPPLDVDAGR